MKKLILSLTLSLTIGVTTLFANEITVSDRVKQSFEKEFSKAQLVTWNNAGEFLKASFVWAGHRAEAYFNQEGQLQGCARDIFYDQLPMAVMTSLDKKFAGADVIDVNEITNSEGTNYRLTLEVSGKKYRVKCDTAGNVVETERLKK